MFILDVLCYECVVWMALYLERSAWRRAKSDKMNVCPVLTLRLEESKWTYSVAHGLFDKLNGMVE